MRERFVNFTQNNGEIWKFIKFAFTGASTSVLEMAVFLFLQYAVFKSLNEVPVQNNAFLGFLGIEYKGYMYSYAISAVIGYAAAYIMNRRLTFKADANPVISTVIYAVMVVMTIIFNTWFGAFLGTWTENKGLKGVLTDIITKVVVMTVPTLWTYPMNRFVIHRNKKTTVKTVIAADLDGTLLSSDLNVSKENLEAIERLSKREIKTVILTGRTFYEIPLELRRCKYIDYFVYSNGAGIQSSYKGIVYYHPIEKKTAREIYKFLTTYETLIEIYSNQAPYMEKDKFSDEAFDYFNIDRDFIPELHRSRRKVLSLKALTENDDYKIEMFNVFFKNTEDIDECRRELLNRFDTINTTSSMSNNLEIVNKSADKGTGLKTLCRIAGYNIENVIAVGDSKNDIAAFETVKKCFAVSNACNELKNTADRVICSNNENIMCFLEKEL